MSKQQNNALVIVPHQDDETALVGNIIGEIANRWNLYILYSSIDSNPEKGRIRKEEAISACSIWGIRSSNIIFLDYPDSPNKLRKHFYSDGDKKIEEDLISWIVKLKPEIIFATDFDFHSDHRMLCIAFDYALHAVLSLYKSYKPIVLKGFCYETSYYGVEDYKTTKPGSCMYTNLVLSNASYNWDDRVIINSPETGKFIWNRKALKALCKHRSQYSVLHAKSIVNGDNVFWQKRTDNLLNISTLTASSGLVEKLRDLLVIDTDNLITKDPREIDYSKSLWHPKGETAWIKATWENPVKFDRIIIHGDPNKKHSIPCEIEILVNENQVSKISNLKEYGKPTEIRIDTDICYCLEFKLINISIDFGLSEIEVLFGRQDIPSYLQAEKSEEKRNFVSDLIGDLGYECIKFTTRTFRKFKSFHKR